MRKTINLNEIKPGKRAVAWVMFCIRKDNIRRKYNPNYNPMELSPETDLFDWLEFCEEWDKSRSNDEAS